MAFLCCCSSFSRPLMPDLSLSLVSSSNTFLNGLVVDKDTRKPIYSIDTLESLTSIVRQTPSTAGAAHRARRGPAWSGPSPQNNNNNNNLVATVQWPERSPHIVPLRPGAPQPTVRANPRRDQDSVHIHLDDGSVTPLPRFLKRRSQALAGTFHKFRIPGYPATFKWKRNGRTYQLRATGIRSLLAELTSDTLTASLELSVYGAFIPSHHNQDQPGSVSSVLLDYTVLTALLLVTPLREWTRFSARHARALISSAWGEGDRDGDGDGYGYGYGYGDSEGELGSEEWEEPSRFRWGRTNSHRHHTQHHQQHQQRQDQDQDQRRREQWGDRGGEVDAEECEALSDEMREVANATLFATSQFATRRRRSIATTASTDSSRTLVTPHPHPHPHPYPHSHSHSHNTIAAILVPTPITTHSTGRSATSATSATSAQEVVRRALAMDLERDLGEYPSYERRGGC